MKPTEKIYKFKLNQFYYSFFTVIGWSISYCQYNKWKKFDGTKMLILA